MRSAAALIACLSLGLVPHAVRAWGYLGHELVNRAAVLALPATVPAFLRSRQAIDDVALLGPELDALKGAGTSWDRDHDPGHYLDLRDDGTIAGVVRLNALPPTREAYDLALRAAGTDEYAQGFLPYAILDGWEQLRRDFAFWRLFDAQVRNAASPTRRAEALERRTLEELLIVRDIGVWGHYVADASQPLHVTVHYDGWGLYPNPEHFTQARTLHAFFESTFVAAHATLAGVRARMASSDVRPTAHLVSQARILHRIERYLAATNAEVVPLYRLERAGGFARATPQAIAFVDARLAAGASELRDLVLSAWYDSANVTLPAEAMR